MNSLAVALVKILEVIGYFCIGLALSAVASGVVLWATDALPEVGIYEVFWQAQVGAALGYGLVSTVMAVPVWLLASLLRRLRWLKAWGLALILANGLTIAAAITAFVRTTAPPA